MSFGNAEPNQFAQYVIDFSSRRLLDRPKSVSVQRPGAGRLGLSVWFHTLSRLLARPLGACYPGRVRALTSSALLARGLAARR